MKRTTNTMKLYIGLLAFFTIILISCDKEDIAPSVEEKEISCIPQLEIPLGDSLYYFEHWAGEQEFGFVTAIRDSLKWEADAKAFFVYDSTLVISGRTFFSKEEPTRTIEEFSIRTNIDSGCFSVSPRLFGSNTDQKLPYARYNTVDLDIFINQYTLLEEADNKLELIKIDTINNKVEGKFMLTFLRNETTRPQRGPDTLRFHNGYFKCQIVD